MRNTSRHDTESIRNPPRNGPNAVATPASPDQAPIAAPRSAGRNEAEMMARLPGMSNAAVRPCNARAAMRVPIDGAMPLNTHGGLLSYGHCGVGGAMAHVVETYLQMTGRADNRQVRDASMALLHGDGGVLSSHVSMFLERLR